MQENFLELCQKQKQIMDEKNILICVYSNASGFLWSLMMAKGGTDLGWSGFTGDCPLSGTFTTYEKALGNAIAEIGDYTLDFFRKRYNGGWGDFATWIKYRARNID